MILSIYKSQSHLTTKASNLTLINLIRSFLNNVSTRSTHTHTYTIKGMHDFAAIKKAKASFVICYFKSIIINLNYVILHTMYL